MIKKILLFIISLIVVNSSFGYETDYLDYADIPGTDIINMNGQFDGNIYQVYIDTGDIYYITGNDNKLHNCFQLIGTGYTEKLGLIYFQYENKGSYICDDYKLRGVFKIEAGGWGYMEDLENNPENWKNFLDKTATDGYYYHNGDGNGNGTGQAYLDGIGFSNWDTVRTKANLAKYFSNITISSLINGNDIIANGEDTAIIGILLKYNGKELKNYKVDSINFSNGYDSDIEENGIKISPFKYSGPLETDENGLIKGNVSSLNGNKLLKYGLNIKIGNYDLINIGETSAFKVPFDIAFDLQSKETDKILVGWMNKGKLKLTNIDNKISNLTISDTSNYIKFYKDGDYFEINTGNNINIDNTYYDLKVSYVNFYKEDEAKIQYIINGEYGFTKNGKNYKINLNKYFTNTQSVYKDGKIYSISIKEPNSYAVADGINKEIYQIYFYDKNGWKINNLDFEINIKDPNKYFDLQIDNDYQTGFFTEYFKDKISGTYKTKILSYKPVNNKEIELALKNITYYGYYNFLNNDITKTINITFTNPTNSSFEDKILKINREDNISYSFLNNLGTNITNPYFIFTGYAQDCIDCNFEKGLSLSGNNFNDYDFNIYITSSDSPSAVIYSGYIQYNLNGDKGNKLVQIRQIKKYSPLLFIQSSRITIIGNMASNKRIIGGIKYVATNLNPTYMKSKLKKIQYDNFIKGSDPIKIYADTNINLGELTGTVYIYRCNNSTLSFIGNYNHNINIYTLGCKINIKNDLIGNGGHLKLYAFSNNKNPSLLSNNGWDIPGNIYINKNVKSIYASLITEGSIFTYDNSISANNIFTGGRSNFKSQLYIKGKIFSKNTLGGGNKYSDGTYMIVNGEKINESSPPSNGLFNNYSVKDIAQAYDMSFWKSTFVNSDGSYDTGNLSTFIYNKYNCSGNKNSDNPLCTTVIIIEDVRN